MTEKRQAVRSEISIIARAYRVKSEADAAGILQGLQAGADFYADIDAELQDFHEYLDPLMLTVSDFLIQIDEKLDRILCHMEGAQEIAGTIEVLSTVDLSGIGICLLLGESVEVGEKLALVLRIPGFPRGVFKCLGQVVRVSEQKTPDDCLCEAGITFLNVTEREQDRLIAFTFSQQRQMLRERKSRPDSAGIY